MTVYDVLLARRYSFTDSASGKKITGSKLTVVGDPISDPDLKGRAVIEFSAPYEVYDVLTTIPGKYRLELSARMNGNKPTMIVTSVAPVESK
jgi:hypothetical protein